MWLRRSFELASLKTVTVEKLDEILRKLLSTLVPFQGGGVGEWGTAIVNSPEIFHNAGIGAIEGFWP